MRARIDSNTWSKAIHKVHVFTAPGIVKDSNGNETLTKFTKPIPSDSSKIHVSKDPLEPFAIKLQSILTGPKSVSQAAEELKLILEFNLYMFLSINYYIKYSNFNMVHQINILYIT